MTGRPGLDVDLNVDVGFDLDIRIDHDAGIRNDPNRPWSLTAPLTAPSTLFHESWRHDGVEDVWRR
jgi:hypothetical protein